MWWVDRIFSLVWDISDFFHHIGFLSGPIPLVGSQLREWFYTISDAFWYLLTPIAHFGDWVDDVASKVANILDIDAIITALAPQWQLLMAAYTWVYNAVTNITSVIDTWWSTARLELLSYIVNLGNWTVSQLNSLEATFTALIASVELWTLSQIDSVKSALLAIIWDLRLWTQTEINTISNTITTLISNVESWTLTQINSVKSAILAIIGDLETWTITEINTIQATLTTLIDWTALTNWITGWWNERLLDVQGLINTAFIERQSFWAGWQDWRDKVAEFFSDPLGWLESRFTNWFLGAE